MSGLAFAFVARIPGNVLKGNWTAAIYVTDRATPQQKAAILDVWTGKCGGPIADLAALVGEIKGVHDAPIEFKLEKGKGTLRIGQQVEAEMAPYTDATRQPHDDQQHDLQHDSGLAGLRRQGRLSPGEHPRAQGCSLDASRIPAEAPAFPAQRGGHRGVFRAPRDPGSSASARSPAPLVLFAGLVAGAWAALDWLGGSAYAPYLSHAPVEGGGVSAGSWPAGS